MKDMNDPTGPVQRDQPICVSVIICNEIIEDKRTNNKTLVSLFNSMTVTALPAFRPSMAIMVSLTNGLGKWPIAIVIKSPSDKEIARIQFEVAFRDPIAVDDYSFTLQMLPLPEEGVYFVDVVCGNYPLGHRRFTVSKVEAPQTGNPPQPPVMPPGT